jgi:hypothetical protein
MVWLSRPPPPERTLSNLLTLVIAMIAGTLVLKALNRAFPGVLGQRLQLAAGVAAGLGALYLVARGQVGAALGMAMTALWLLQGAGKLSIPGIPGISGSAKPAPGRQSTVRTEHLEMVLDLDSGDMRGVVLKGFFRGRRIEQLRPVELAHLWQDCRFVEPQSAQLVEAYLDRVHPTWREDLARAEAEAPKGPDGKMTRGEAFDILGLKPGASDDDIRRAHRDLIVRFHPDRGGSTYLAAKINEAKDVALGGGE